RRFPRGKAQRAHPGRRDHPGRPAAARAVCRRDDLVLLEVHDERLDLRRRLVLWRPGGPLDHQVDHAARLWPPGAPRVGQGLAPCARAAWSRTTLMEYFGPLAMGAALLL